MQCERCHKFLLKGGLCAQCRKEVGQEETQQEDFLYAATGLTGDQARRVYRDNIAP